MRTSLVSLACILLLVSGTLGCQSVGEARHHPARTVLDSGPNDTAELSRLLREAEGASRAGNLTSAVEQADRALALAEQTTRPELISAARSTRGSVFLAEGNADAARREFEEAIDQARKAGNAALELAARSNLANVLRIDGQFDAATAEYARAIAIARDRHDSLSLARAAVGLVRTYANLAGAEHIDALSSGAGADAIVRAQAAIGAVDDPPARAGFALHAARSLLMEGERVGSAGGAPAAESELLAAAEVLLAIGREAAEQARDEALLAELIGEDGYRLALAGQPAEALERTRLAIRTSEAVGSEANRVRWHHQAASLLREAGEYEAAIEQSRRAVQLLQTHRHLLTTESRRERPESENRRDSLREIYLGYVDLLLQRTIKTQNTETVRNDLELARDTLEAFKAAELRDYFADECVDHYRGRIQKVDAIASDTVVIYPIVLPDRLELLVSRSGDITQRTVVVAETEIRETVAQLRELLVKRTTHQYRVPAKKVYDWIIRPIEDLLAGDDVTTLVFVPDGILRTIPLAALHDGEGFLIERYAIATTPGIDLTDPKPLDRTNLDVLLGGLTEGREGFAPLPHVEEELSGVQAILGGELLVDESFERRALSERIAGTDFDLVHIATHAKFDDDTSSGFLLTHDGRLGMDEFADSIAGDRFREKPLELLVLSACETARGDERAALGLSGIAIKAGARSAIGSLWMVNDEAAALLLVEFYKALAGGQVSRAEALQRAQRSLIAQSRYRHPAYWSAFLLLNSWL